MVIKITPQNPGASVNVRAGVNVRRGLNGENLETEIVATLSDGSLVDGEKAPYGHWYKVVVPNDDEPGEGYVLASLCEELPPSENQGGSAEEQPEE